MRTAEEGGVQAFQMFRELSLVSLTPDVQGAIPCVPYSQGRMNAYCHFLVSYSAPWRL